MRFLDYLADRIVPILIYFLGISIALLAVGLELAASGFPVRSGTFVYALLLSTVLLLICLAAGYYRRKPFYRQVGRAIASNGCVSHVVSIKDPVSKEEQMLTKLAHSISRQYHDELTSFGRKEELRQHFSDRWVHHMKTPVSVIELLLQQREEITGAEEAKNLLDSIDEENQRLAERLELFLNSVRMERFEKDFRIESVDVLQLSRDVLNSHKKEFIRYSIFPEIKCKEPESWVPTDRKWMKFVIDQIVSNAIKYTRIKHSDTEHLVHPANVDEAGYLKNMFECRGKASGPSGQLLKAPEGTCEDATNDRVESLVDLSVKSDEATGKGSKRLMVFAKNEGDTSTLSIQDEGVGIPPEDIPRVFDPFFTGFNGRLVPESTGMGLYLARQVIGNLGHRISIDSTLGDGTTVTVTFRSDSIAEGVIDRTEPRFSYHCPNVLMPKRGEC